MLLFIIYFIYIKYKLIDILRYSWNCCIAKKYKIKDSDNDEMKNNIRKL